MIIKSNIHLVVILKYEVGWTTLKYGEYGRAIFLLYSVFFSLLKQLESLVAYIHVFWVSGQILANISLIGNHITSPYSYSFSSSIHWTPTGAGVSSYIEDPLVAFGCCLLYGRVVVALAHSRVPFSILLYSYFDLSFVYTLNYWNYLYHTYCVNHARSMMW